MRKFVICWIAMLSLRTVSVLAEAVCAVTPAAAIESSGTVSLSMPMGESYRVTSIHWDPVLRQSWATIARCDHPEWPKFTLRAGERNAVFTRLAAQVRDERLPTLPVVRAGDIVRLWRQEDLLRIEVTGVAEESGSVGKTIRVRLLRRKMDGQSEEKQFTGIVRGPSDVEMLR
jgi:hypothetical protein